MRIVDAEGAQRIRDWAEGASTARILQAIRGTADDEPVHPRVERILRNALRAREERERQRLRPFPGLRGLVSDPTLAEVRVLKQARDGVRERIVRGPLRRDARGRVRDARGRFL